METGMKNEIKMKNPRKLQKIHFNFIEKLSRLIGLAHVRPNDRIVQLGILQFGDFVE